MRESSAPTANPRTGIDPSNEIVPPPNSPVPEAESSLALARTSIRTFVTAPGRPCTWRSSAFTSISPATVGAATFPVTRKLPSSFPVALSTLGTSRGKTARSTGSSFASNASVGSLVTFVTPPFSRNPPRKPPPASEAPPARPASSVTSRGGTVSVSSASSMASRGGCSVSLSVPREANVGPSSNRPRAFDGASRGRSSTMSSPQSCPATGPAPETTGSSASSLCGVAIPATAPRSTPRNDARPGDVRRLGAGDDDVRR